MQQQNEYDYSSTFSAVGGHSNAEFHSNASTLRHVE